MSAEVAREAVGFIGAGAMGRPLLERLAERGFPVLLSELDPRRREAAISIPGVQPASSVADLGRVGIVVCMLPSSAEVEAVVTGSGGLLESLSARSLILDMGSSDPRSTRALAARAAERDIDYADAPVSGGVAGAKAGTLTAMFGGSSQQLARCRPFLEAMTGRIVHVGATGSGHAMKALNNLLSAIGLAAAAEVIEIGRRFGLDPVVMLEVLNASTGRNHATETKVAQFVLSGTFASGFGLRLMLKDIGTAMALAKDTDVEAAIGETCLRVWERGAAALPADADQTRIAEVVTGRVSNA